jgi:ADP-ribose pyrophosphatase YjhB (NUDIX family)
MQRGQDAAGIIIIDEQDRVLLVHQTYGKKQWATPGGMVEEGESAWEAAARELKEEINLTVSGMELSGMYFQPHTNRYVYLFRARSFEGAPEIDQKEIDQFGFFSLDNLPRPISSFTAKRIWDAVHNTKTVFRNEHLMDYELLQ